MSTVEDLLRETLHDERHRLEATPALRIAVRQRHQTTRRRRVGLAVTAGLAAAAVALGVSVVLYDRPQASGPTSRIELPGQPSDAVLQDGMLWVTTIGDPGWLLAIDPATGRPVRQRRLPEIPDGARRDYARLAVDPEAGLLWAVRDAGPDGNSVRATVSAFELRSLAPRGTWELDSYFGERPVASGGRLWTLGIGLLMIEPGRQGVTELPDTESAVRVLRDPRSGQLVVAREATLPVLGGITALEVLVVDPRTREVVRRELSDIALGQPAGVQLTMSRNGRLWAVGESGSTPTNNRVMRRLEPDTLSEISGAATLPLSRRSSLLDKGGDQVIWVTDGGQAVCVDADTGAVLGRIPDEPSTIVSERGRAFGIHWSRGVAGLDGELRRLTMPPGCPG